MIMFFAHGDQVDAASEAGWLESLSHQPLWISLLVIAMFLFALFNVLGLVRINWLTRLLLLVPVMIGIAVLYLQHAPLITAIVLTAGFITTFLLVFGMIVGKK